MSSYCGKKLTGDSHSGGSVSGTNRNPNTGGNNPGTNDNAMKRFENISSSSLSSSIRISQDKLVDSFEKRWKLRVRDTAKLTDFEIHRTVGVGAFGRVRYVQYKENQRRYALKIMLKEKIVRMGQVDRVHYEKRILQSVTHPFLVDLRYVFKTNLHLCIVMPFVRGGEIFSYMRAFNVFSEFQTQFYAAQMVLALQYLHSMKIVYRDLKPENVLLECDGYIKITDFGFSKRLEGPNMLTTSFVGTPEYMAPEMLVRARRVAGYSFSVDWWTLGVFIYESAAGSPPFSGSSLLAIFDRVVRAEYILPDHFSIAMADLVVKLFDVNADQRIGCGRTGAEEIKSHYWFTNVNWQALIEKQIRPEFVPKCSDIDVTSNYEIFEEEPIECSENAVYTQEFNEF